MPSKWIEHVKAHAKEKGMRYKDALSCPECKASYKSGKGLETPLRNMTRYGKPGTFTKEDVEKINNEDKERSAMKKASVNSVTY